MDTRVRRRRALAVAIAVLLLPIVAGSVAAAKAPKIAVCHLDQVLGTYSLVMIAQSSLAKHLAHGDGLPGEGQFDASCQIVVEPRVFALAFTNADGVAGYQAGGTDVLIAKLVDTSGDGAVGGGDTVITNQYPLGFDFASDGFGFWGVTSHTVDHLGSTGGLTNTVVVVDASTPDPIEYVFGSGTLSPSFHAHTYVERLASAPTSANFVQDVFGEDSVDAISVTFGLNSPSAFSNTRQSNSTDDAFIDVILDLPA